MQALARCQRIANQNETTTRKAKAKNIDLNVVVELTSLSHVSYITPTPNNAQLRIAFWQDEIFSIDIDLVKTLQVAVS